MLDENCSVSVRGNGAFGQITVGRGRKKKTWQYSPAHHWFDINMMDSGVLVLGGCSGKAENPH